jgi:hypothetical protein
MKDSRIDGRRTTLGLKLTHETGDGCLLSKRGSRSSGLHSVIVPSARPIASIAQLPSAELKDREVTCAAYGAFSESGRLLLVVSLPFDSDHRKTCDPSPTARRSTVGEYARSEQ